MNSFGSTSHARGRPASPCSASRTIPSFVDLEKIHPEGFFSGVIPGVTERFDYRLRLTAGSESWIVEDPYAFDPGAGRSRRVSARRGPASGTLSEARLPSHDAIRGWGGRRLFAVWAPNARRVSVVGEFNAWDGRRHPMRKRHGSGVVGTLHTRPGGWRGLQIRDRRRPWRGPAAQGGPGLAVARKSRPPRRPSSPASRSITWGDDAWLSRRADLHGHRFAPISIYELPSGQAGAAPAMARCSITRRFADHLIPYIKETGFTHVELLPVTEHVPFSRFRGAISPSACLRRRAASVRRRPLQNSSTVCMRQASAWLVDWCRAHFPSDAHGLARFDGTALYEHEAPRLGFHQDWNTLIYQFRLRLRSRELPAEAARSSWIDQFHIDGLARRCRRLHALSRLHAASPGRNGIPNPRGRQHPTSTLADFPAPDQPAGSPNAIPGAMDHSERSHGLSGRQPPGPGRRGLRLSVLSGTWAGCRTRSNIWSRDRIHRRHHHHQMTFGMVLCLFRELSCCRFSHDEVVHRKRVSDCQDAGRQIGSNSPNLRALSYTFMCWSHPGQESSFVHWAASLQQEQ